MKIVFIGSGNLATHLAIAMKASGNEVAQVYSRTLSHAKALAKKIDAACTDNIALVNPSADVYIFSVKDDTLPEILAQMPPTQGMWAHTAGSVPMNVFAPYKTEYGVLYPLQTFSKERNVNFSDIPVFIEGSSPETVFLLEKLAVGISKNVRTLSSEKRLDLHLAAVFACNFTNHMYSLAEEILQKEDIPFDVLKPLIAETAAKVMDMSPKEAQTGPAVRFDEAVMRKHIDLLEDAEMKEIYLVLSKNIHKHSL